MKIRYLLVPTIIVLFLSMFLIGYGFYIDTSDLNDPFWNIGKVFGIIGTVSLILCFFVISLIQKYNQQNHTPPREEL